jgi:hypothetical protein
MNHNLFPPYPPDDSASGRYLLIAAHEKTIPEYTHTLNSDGTLSEHFQTWDESRYQYHLEIAQTAPPELTSWYTGLTEYYRLTADYFMLMYLTEGKPLPIYKPTESNGAYTRQKYLKSPTVTPCLTTYLLCLAEYRKLYVDPEMAAFNARWQSGN